MDILSSCSMNGRAFHSHRVRSLYGVRASGESKINYADYRQLVTNAVATGLIIPPPVDPVVSKKPVIRRPYLAQANCILCSAEFTKTTHNMGYCHACRSKKIPCKNCGKMFPPDFRKKGKSVNCSRICAAASLKADRKGKKFGKN